MCLNCRFPGALADPCGGELCAAGDHGPVMSAGLGHQTQEEGGATQLPAQSVSAICSGKYKHKHREGGGLPMG